MKYKDNATSDGFTLMCEYINKRTLLLWPSRTDVWHDDAKEAEAVHVELAKTINKYEKVVVGVNSELIQHVSKLLPDIEVIALPQDDAWIRDSGPLFTSNGSEIRVVDNRFNAWGGLYENYLDDDLITKRLSELYRFDYYENPLIMEGGNISSDGEGTAILVKNCIVNPNRNHESVEEIEQMLMKYLGLKKIIWIDYGFVEDETDGHVDNIVQFTKDKDVIMIWTDDVDHPMYQRCRDIYNQLHNQTKANGKTFIIHKVKAAPATYRSDIEIDKLKNSGIAKVRLAGDLLTNSYINFYYVKGAIIVPQFGVAEDEEALITFAKVFPDLDIVPFYSREYILAGGGVHCLTLGVPEEIFKK